MYHTSQRSAVYLYTRLQAKAIYQSTQKKDLFKKRHHPGHTCILPLVPSTLAGHSYLGIALDILLLSG